MHMLNVIVWCSLEITTSYLAGPDFSSIVSYVNRSADVDNTDEEKSSTVLLTILSANYNTGKGVIVFD